MPRGAPLNTRWFDGVSARGHAVHLRIDGDELVLEPVGGAVEGESRRYPLRQVRWPERRTHGQRQTDLPDGGLIQHADSIEWDAWWADQGFEESMVVGWTQNWRGVLVALLATVVVLGGTWWWGVPWASQQIAQQIPPSIDERIGARTLAQIEELWLEPSALSPAEERVLRKRWDDLVAAAHPDGEAPTHVLLFRRAPELGPNALALPGGQIVVTDELVALLRDQPDVLMGVIAHELGHVQNRDGLDMLVRSTFISALVGVVFGDMSGFVAAVPAALITQAYSREAERRADAHAAELLHRSGISPAVMQTLFERLQRERSEGGGDDALPIAIASHPADEERIRFFRDWAPDR